MTDPNLQYGATDDVTVPADPPGVSASHAVAPYLAEFVGTFILAFTVGSCLVAPGGLIWNATSIGSAFMVLAYSTGPISGGNLNPAITLSLGFIGAIQWSVVVRYWAAQFAGALAGSLCFRMVFGTDDKLVGPRPHVTWEVALLLEAIYTAVLCFVAASCALSLRNNARDDRNQFFAMAIGFAMIAGGYAAGDVSGACLNPAIAIGLDATSAGNAFGEKFMLSSSEIVGALLATALFPKVRPEVALTTDQLHGFRPSLLTKCFAEFVGVFIFVLTVGLATIEACPLAPWAAATVLMSMSYSLRDVSGAHFNPAVTVAVMFSGRSKFPVGDALAYMASQISAGVLAGCTYACINATTDNKDVFFGLGPKSWYHLSSAGAGECVFTFMLVYVVQSCDLVSPTSSRRPRQSVFFTLAIGACVATGGFCLSSVSGGAMNPALSLGITAASMTHRGFIPHAPLANCMIFSAWQFFGGLLASIVFRYTHPMEYRTTPLLEKG